MRHLLLLGSVVGALGLLVPVAGCGEPKKAEPVVIEEKKDNKTPETKATQQSSIHVDAN
jgi:hypothetical protein